MIKTVSSLFALILFSCLSVSGSAQPLLLDFDTDASGATIQSGQVIDLEYIDWGVEIWAENLSRGPDLATAYSSGLNGRDPDLETPWDGGNYDASDPSQSEPGNLLIIQENRNGCGDGVCNRPDDEGSRPAGSLFFDFNQEITSATFDLVDVESPEELSGGYIALLDEDRNVINNSQINFEDLSDRNNNPIDSSSWADNFYNAVGTIFFDVQNLSSEVFGLQFNMGGSGALNNLSVTTHSVPEIDTASSPIALGLLAALIALIRERRISLSKKL